MFHLNYIKIEEGSTGQKILSPGFFHILNEDSKLLPEAFYGCNITVSAIVGKNGSGKSTLLDLIYRVMNNLSAILSTKINREDNSAFTFITGLKVELSFSVDYSTYTVCCKDESLFMDIKGSKGEKKLFFGIGKVPEGYTHLKIMTDETRQEIAHGIFYCMSLNYAPFAMNSSEYQHELSVAIEDELSPGRIDLRRLNWMQSVFHKNDGYLSNITFVPYRDYGKFDATKESKLNRERLLEILVVHSNFIEGYRLGNVKLRVDKEIFKSKFACTRPSRENNYTPPKDVSDVINEFDLILEDYKRGGSHTVATRILSVFGIKRRDIIMQPQYVYAYIYLVYKVLNAAQYPSFIQYQDLNNPDLAIDKKASDKLLNRAACLAREVLANHSHITFKIERVLNYLSVVSVLDWDKICSNGYTLEEYWMHFPENLVDESVIVKARHLPPSFLSPEVFLIPNGQHNKEMPFEQLSSGERQFYSTISAIVYHSMNIISAQQDSYRVKYRNMLIVLDEIEMCFHPEYQRTFLNNLISTIKRLNFNKYLSFHILLTSHSPFILSDIPHSNILYLEKGEAINTTNFINPFGANINDILSQSFFLERGFIGELAKDIINSLYRYLKSEGENDCYIKWNEESAKYVIDILGEPLLRNTLNQLYTLKFESLADLERQKIEIEKLIRLKSRKDI